MVQDVGRQGAGQQGVGRRTHDTGRTQDDRRRSKMRWPLDESPWMDESLIDGTWTNHPTRVRLKSNGRRMEQVVTITVLSFATLQQRWCCCGAIAATLLLLRRYTITASLLLRRCNDGAVAVARQWWRCCGAVVALLLRRCSDDAVVATLQRWHCC